MKISLTLHDDMIRISPAVRLGESQFNLFLAACKSIGAKFDKKASAQTISIAQLNPTIDTMRSHGFTVAVSPRLYDKAKDTGVTSSIREAADHLSDIKKLLNRPLFPHQEVGVRFLRSKKNALLLDGTGTGKTQQAACAIPLDKPPVLIICPAVVKFVWMDELKTLRPDYANISILKGRNSFRYPLPGEIVITNYDIIPDAQRKGGRAYRLDESLGKPHTGTVLIFDEIHRAKGNKGGRSGRGGVRRARGAYTIGKDVTHASGYVWGLTGTPLMNHPGELWNICGVVGVQSEAFNDWPTYLRLFGVDPNVKKNFFGGIPWNDPSPEVAVRLERVALRRTLESVLPSMPPIRIQDIEVDIDSATATQCEKALKELAKVGVSLEAALEIVENTKDSGAGFKELARARVMLAAAKVPHALDIIEEAEESGDPMLVFCCARAPIDILKDRPGWATITGSVTGLKRKSAIDAMQAGRLKGLGITIKAGGEGITLTRAATSLFIDLEWTPASNSQAIARIRRIGQTKPQLIKRLIANHELDRRITEILDRKQALIDATVEKMTAVTELHAPSDIETVVGNAVIEEPRKIQQQEPRRGPISPVEHWAAMGMERLSSMDVDRAQVRNMQGFSAADTDQGHAYAERLKEYGLTNSEWLASVKMMMKYQSQIGMIPR